MREYRTTRGGRGDQSEGSTSEQDKFSIAPSLWELPICPPRFPSTSSSIPRYEGGGGGGQRPFLLAAIFDAGRRGLEMREEARIARQQRRNPHYQPLSSRVLSRDVLVYTVEEQVMPPALSGLELSQPAPKAVSEKWYGSEARKVSWDVCCSCCILCSVEKGDGRETMSFVGERPHLANLPPFDRPRIHVSRDNCGANFPFLAPIPTRDGGLCMLPMHVAYAVCSVYMPVGRGGIDVEASSTRAQAQIEA